MLRLKTIHSDPNRLLLAVESVESHRHVGDMGCFLHGALRLHAVVTCTQTDVAAIGADGAPLGVDALRISVSGLQSAIARWLAAGDSGPTPV